ncbi:MAG: response regulator [Candidatus Zixiibacteriota bacterium]
MEKLTILVVDDEIIIRDLLYRSLTRLGYNVLTACDGLEAVRMYRDHQDEIALVILDYFMPNMNGWEAHEQIRAINSNVKTVLSSGQPEAKMTLAELPGITEILIKPYLINELQDVVQSALNGVQSDKE